MPKGLEHMANSKSLMTLPIIQVLLSSIQLVKRQNYSLAFPQLVVRKDRRTVFETGEDSPSSCIRRKATWIGFSSTLYGKTYEQKAFADIVLSLSFSSGTLLSSHRLCTPKSGTPSPT
jgi:hypothetical protein